jgi:hypothetical protein
MVGMLPQTLSFLADFVDLLSCLYELRCEAPRSGCARPITPRAVLSIAGGIINICQMMSLIQPTTSAPHWLAGMVGVLPQVLPFFAALVVVVVVLVALLPRLRRVSLEALRGPMRFFFTSPRPRAALPSAGPSLLPSRAGKRSRPRAERRPAKSGAHPKEGA